MNNLPSRRDDAASQPVVQAPSAQAQLAMHQSPLIPRIQLARVFPRDVESFRGRLRDEVIAAPTGMVYRKPQGKDHLIGPSVRMAEIAARLFANLHISEPKIDEHDGRVTVTVEALDLETNVSVPGVASNSLVGSGGRRMRADIVSNLIAAAAAKAKRNAVFGIVGKSVFDDLVGAAMAAQEKLAAAAQVTEQKSGRPGELWAKHVAGWAKAGITEMELLRACGVAGPSEVTPKMFADLAASVQAVKEGTPARVALGLDLAEPPPSAGDVEEFFDQQGGV